MNAIPFTIHPDAFIHDCLTTVTHFIPGATAAFYLVDNQLTPEHHLLSGIDPQTHQDYLASFMPIDPLHPRRFNHLPVTLARLEESSHTTDFYRRFMQPNGISDMVEVYVRQRKRIVAGLSLMRDRAFTLAERLKLRASLPLLSLATEELIPCEQQCRLTPKERQIVEMVREGSCNKRIALRLDISLSTVKTHLRNIFAKTNANSRTELLSCLGMACDRDYLM